MNLKTLYCIFNVCFLLGEHLNTCLKRGNGLWFIGHKTWVIGQSHWPGITCGPRCWGQSVFLRDRDYHGFPFSYCYQCAQIWVVEILGGKALSCHEISKYKAECSLHTHHRQGLPSRAAVAGVLIGAMWCDFPHLPFLGSLWDFR